MASLMVLQIINMYSPKNLTFTGQEAFKKLNISSLSRFYLKHQILDQLSPLFLGKLKAVSQIPALPSDYKNQFPSGKKRIFYIKFDI